MMLATSFLFLGLRTVVLMIPDIRDREILAGPVVLKKPN